MNTGQRFFLHIYPNPGPSLSVTEGWGVSTDHQFCLQQAIALTAPYDTLWISSVVSLNEKITAPSTLILPANKVRSVLGRSFSLLIFDTFSGFDVNALAAASGTIRGGGGLILLSPEPELWPQYADPDYRRFLPWPYQPEGRYSYFLQYLIQQLKQLKPPPEPLIKNGSLVLDIPDKVRVQEASQEQKTLLTLLSGCLAKNLLQKPKQEQVFVLTAARGRGKSTLLGLLSQRLQKTGLKILLTAPSKQAVVEIEKHIPLKAVFYAPDDLLQQQPTGDVLLVDEAAAIPLSLLEQMLVVYPHCILATTTQGYEGSGRGFVLRFTEMLNQKFPDWQALQLQQPIRWAADDGLEVFLNEWLSLATGLPKAPQFLKATDWHYQYLSAVDLSRDRELLKSVFALLVTAHYQTRPADLRQLLDAPNISVHVLTQKNSVLAVALMSREGGLDKELTIAIHQGKRRPHGHLIPQNLTFHLGIEGAACLFCERVMRIAVHPQWQRRGVGHYLLSQLEQYARLQNADYLGTSYADTVGLRVFWQRAGFVAARLGMRKDKASGCYSIIQLKALTERGETLSQRCQELWLCQQGAE